MCESLLAHQIYRSATMPQQEISSFFRKALNASQSFLSCEQNSSEVAKELGPPRTCTQHARMLDRRCGIFYAVSRSFLHVGPLPQEFGPAYVFKQKRSLVRSSQENNHHRIQCSTQKPKMKKRYRQCLPSVEVFLRFAQLSIYTVSDLRNTCKAVYNALEKM